MFTPDLIKKDKNLYGYGEDLFKKKGFCVIKNFLNKDDTQHLRKKGLSDKSYSIKMAEEGNIYTYFYKNKKSNFDNKVNEISIKINKLRNSILLQSNSDQHLRSYCWRYGLDPLDEDKLSDHQQSHSYTRLNRQKKSAYFHYHYDSPGEIQAMLYLSQYGLDYNEGGLVCVGYDGKEYEIDKNVNIGDLVLVNAYACKHKVNKILCSPEQAGRITFFAPIISESHPMFGRTYFFKENRFKLYLKIPNEFHNFESRLFKMTYIFILYYHHFKNLISGRSKSVDHTHKN